MSLHHPHPLAARAVRLRDRILALARELSPANFESDPPLMESIKRAVVAQQPIERYRDRVAKHKATLDQLVHEAQQIGTVAAHAKDEARKDEARARALAATVAGRRLPDGVVDPDVPAPAAVAERLEHIADEIAAWHDDFERASSAAFSISSTLAVVASATMRDFPAATALWVDVTKHAKTLTSENAGQRP